MKHTPRAHWLLALAFLLGQSLALVHATSHELVAGDAPSACASCAVAHSPGATADSLVAANTPQPHVTSRAPRVDAPFTADTAPCPPSRGPPPSLA